MFEYILAGFTGTFFSYCFVFFSGVQLHACAKGVASDRVIDVMNDLNDMQNKRLDRMERKMERMERTTETIQRYVEYLPKKQ